MIAASKIGGMRCARQTVIENEIKRLRAEIADLRQRRYAVLTGAASAGMSSGGGSKNYSNWTPEKYDAAIAKDLSDIKKLKKALSGRSAFGIGFAMVRRA